MIVEVIQHLCPGWEPPKPNGKEWQKVRCPFHMEDHASAAVSFELDCFSCRACPARGNAVTLLAQQKGITNSDAAKLAKSLFMGGDGEIPSSPPRNTGRRLPFQQRASGGAGTPVRSGIRSRTGTWTR